MTADEAAREAFRQERKRARDLARHCHPFDRSSPAPASGLVDDGNTSARRLVVAVAGRGDKVGVAPVELFEALAGLPLHRVYLRRFQLLWPRSHELGATTEEVLGNLRDLFASHDRVVLVGSSLGGYHALLLATLLDARAIAVKPLSGVTPDALAATGDDREQDDLSGADPRHLAAMGDLAVLWHRRAACSAEVHVPVLDPVYLSHGERLTFPEQVRATRHEVLSPMPLIVRDGTLRAQVCEALDLVDEQGLPS